MKNEKNNERKMDKYEVVKEEVKWYREKNISIMGEIENLDYLEFIYNMLTAFKRKWGI